MLDNSGFEIFTLLRAAPKFPDFDAFAPKTVERYLSWFCYISPTQLPRHLRPPSSNIYQHSTDYHPFLILYCSIYDLLLTEFFSYNPKLSEAVNELTKRTTSQLKSRLDSKKHHQQFTKELTELNFFVQLKSFRTMLWSKSIRTSKQLVELSECRQMPLTSTAI